MWQKNWNPWKCSKNTHCQLSQKKKKWISDATYAAIREKREAKGEDKKRYQELKVEVQRKLSSHDLSHHQLTDPTRRGHSSESNVLILHWVLKSEVLKCQVSICRSKKLLLCSNKRHIYLLQDMAWCTAFRRLRLLGQKRASVMSGGEWPANSSVLTKWRRWRRISGSRRTPHTGVGTGPADSAAAGTIIRQTRIFMFTLYQLSWTWNEKKQVQKMHTLWSIDFQEN